MNQQEFAHDILDYPGAMISGSKSGYREMFPDNIVVFNANIATNSNGKIWHGDLDLTKQETVLMFLRKVCEEDIYIFYEQDYRFENETKSLNEVLEKATRYYIVNSEGFKEIKGV